MQLSGFRDRSVRVWYDAGKLESQGLTVLDVNKAIAREHLEVPAGRIETPEREMNVRAEGEAIDVESFRNLVVAYRERTPIRLRDVAVVEDGLEDRRRVGRTMGEPSIGLGITKLRGANAVEVGRDVKAKLEQLKAQLPEGLSLGINWDTTVFVEQAIDEILFTLLLASLLTGLVCWLFLGSWSTTLNVLLAIPTSILGTFIVMYVFGFTLNTFTVLGLTLVVGIVVDDAIMVLENIYRHREDGMGKVRGGLGGRARDHLRRRRRHLRHRGHLPARGLHEGDHRQVLLPVRGHDLGGGADLAARGADPGPHALLPLPHGGEARARIGRQVEFAFARLSAAYLRLLKPALHHRGLVMAGRHRALRGSRSGIVKLLRSEFVPSQDMGRILARFQTPVGSSLDATDRYFTQLETFLARGPRSCATRASSAASGAARSTPASSSRPCSTRRIGPSTRRRAGR